MAAARDVFSPEVLNLFGATRCQQLLDGLEMYQASSAAAVAEWIHLGQLMAQIRQAEGDQAATESLLASHTLTLAEGFLVERAYLQRPEWLNTSAVDLSDPLAQQVLQLGAQVYGRQCAALQQGAG